MGGTETRNSFINGFIHTLLVNTLKCVISSEVLEKVEFYRKGEAVVNVYDVTRCGHLYRAVLNNFKVFVDRVEKEDVFRRYIVNEGLKNLFKRVYNVGGKNKVSDSDTVWTTYINVDNRRVKVVSEPVINVVSDREIVVLRHVKDLKDGKPKKHHVEQASLIQWLALRNNYIAKVRLIYLIGFWREVREFIIDTKIIHSSEFVKDFEDRVAKRVKLVLDGEGPFYGWECGTCFYKDLCGKKLRSSGGEDVFVEPLLNDGEWIWFEDHLLTRTLNVVKKLAEEDIEMYMRWSDKAVSTSIRVGVTDLGECPLRYWFKKEFPYISIANYLRRSILRGITIHSGIEKIIEMFNTIKTCRDLESLGVEDILVEKRVEKDFTVETGLNKYNVKLSGRIDAIIKHRGKAYVLELKTAEIWDKEDELPKESHKQQLQTYLTLLKNVDGIGVEDVEGRLVYVVEKDVEEKDRKTRRLQIKEVEVVSSLGEERILELIQSIINVKEFGYLNPSQCLRYRYCEFKDLCNLKPKQSDQASLRRK